MASVTSIHFGRVLSIAAIAALFVVAPAFGEERDWSKWYRPVDNPVFTSEHGNNHDPIFFHEPGEEYPYKLIIGHDSSGADLWRAKQFSHSSSGWELVSDDYDIGGWYEYDDGVKVGDTYYLYEEGNVYTYTGELADAGGKWTVSGSFPKNQCDDIGVFYEDGLFHIFGEYGDFPDGYDGTSLSHLTSTTGLGAWQMVDTHAVDPNPDGGDTYGVGDPTIAKIEGEYWLFTDRETAEDPYRITAWKSADLNTAFEYVDVAIAPRSEEVDDWDNHRIQDGDIQFVPELRRYVMFANMKDIDGNPGGNFPTLGTNETRVVGVFYSEETIPEPATAGLLAIGGIAAMLRHRSRR